MKSIDKNVYVSMYVALDTAFLSAFFLTDLAPFTLQRSLHGSTRS